MKEASLLACEGLAGVSLVPTAASKKMMLSQIASKQAENGERAGSPDVLRCSSQGHRKDSDKSRSRKDDDSLAEASHSKKTVKKVVVVEQNGSFQVKIPKNFICEHCYGAFRSSYHLKRHILIHTGEKPFECDICDMRFIQKYHLERHKRVHSGEKPYQCERCHQEAFLEEGPVRTLSGVQGFQRPLIQHFNTAASEGCCGSRNGQALKVCSDHVCQAPNQDT
ncbi:PREDICTED: zinc finger protein 740 isoform X2 [Galeopterus variegatus]|uniref:Zinc finger protein 740 isoform X2 n=1 Tax=Galeopterus variegatus TaxID=482537 RepID=A0ABM0QXG7_GALVR|nr:PREDICTED: zinc finger protein 740 isoform X2 [Galeopterus variegatus]